MTRIAYLLLCCICCVPVNAAENSPADGYRGIWYSIGQNKGHGPKYSGGLGTYPANMVPMACYDEKANITWFVYGGTTKQSKKDLQIMIGAFHHDDKTFSRPTTIRDSGGFKDAHANPAMTIGGDGHLYVISATRHGFEGRIYRSLKPHDHSAFEIVHTEYVAYPQIWYNKNTGYTLLHTKYNGQSRFLYAMQSSDGKNWSKRKGYAHFKGHYQNSCQLPNGTIITAFNYHPGGVDKRCNIYVMKSADGGASWSTINSEKLKTPVKSENNPALALNTRSRKQLAYIMDTAYDKQGNPVILFVTSKHFATGPKGDPREWRTLRWTGSTWDENIITTSTNNYDCGNIIIDDTGWLVVGPSGTGPQKLMTGGEMFMWRSKDQGKSWTSQALTVNSKHNHTYARRPIPLHPDFTAFWADGDASKESSSDLFYTNAEGEVFRLPTSMKTDRVQATKVR